MREDKTIDDCRHPVCGESGTSDAELAPAATSNSQRFQRAGVIGLNRAAGGPRDERGERPAKAGKLPLDSGK